MHIFLDLLKTILIDILVHRRKEIGSLLYHANTLTICINGRNEVIVLFNDTLNTFYLCLYSIGGTNDY